MELTDLQQFVAMLNKGNEHFTKESQEFGNTSPWIVTVITRNIKIYFNVDGSYRFMCYEPPRD